MKTWHAITIGQGVALKTPTADGTANQVIETDGNGKLSFVDPPAGGGGEANTSSNAGTGGVGIVLPKSGVDLPFKSINVGTGIAVTDDVGNANVDIALAAASANSLKGNATGGSAAPLDLQSADIATEGTPAAGMFAVGFGTGGALVKYDVDDFLGGGGGTPGGSDTQAQYNNGGSFGGMTAVTYDDANDILLVNGQQATSNPLIVRGAVSQSANITEWQTSDSTPHARITPGGQFSDPDNSTAGEVFGLNANIGATVGPTAFGNGASAGDRGCAFGRIAGADGIRSITMGHNTKTQGTAQINIGADGGVSNRPNHGTWGSAAHPVSFLLSDLGGDPTPLATEAGIFAKDVAGTIELHAIDSAANVTPISPHDENGEWWFHSYNRSTGKRYTARMERLLGKLVELHPELAEFIEEEMPDE